MVKLSKAFAELRPFRALVLGDFMLDTYTTGRVKRISPEAPVPILEVVSEEARPGGAGNVALNLAALRGSVIACGRTGDDATGKELRALLSKQYIDDRQIAIDSNYVTPRKNRLIAESQQLIRIDHETIAPLCSLLEAEILSRLPSLIAQVQIVAISDYGKGFLTNRLIETALHIAREMHIPTVVDPKGVDFAKYSGATLIKPNLSEAFAAAKLPPTAPLEEAARAIFASVWTDLLLITRSEAGMSLFDPEGKRVDFPVRSREVKDVTGAGDTALSVICMALANGLDVGTAAQLANLASGVAIERLGCVQVSLAEIAERLLDFDLEAKIFDENHAHALHQALQNRRYSLLVLKKTQEMSTDLLKSIRKLAMKKERDLIVYVEDSHPEDEFVHFLSSLREVDYLVLRAGDLKRLCEFTRPAEVCTLTGAELTPIGQEGSF